MYLVSVCFTVQSQIMLNYYRWFNANHVHGTIMPRQSSIDPNNVVHAASSGDHKTVHQKDLKAAYDRRKARVSYTEMARHWSLGVDDEGSM
jgi:hypothetical protein